MHPKPVRICIDDIKVIYTHYSIPPNVKYDKSYSLNDGIEYKDSRLLDLEFTDVSLLSVSTNYQGWIIIYNKSLHEDLSRINIVDTSACIRGNSLHFIRHCGSSTIIELMKVHFEILKINMKILAPDQKNVIYENINLVDYKHNKIGDFTGVLFLDPSWYYGESRNNDLHYKYGENFEFKKS